MKTTFAPPLVTVSIFSAWRFICQQLGSPFQAAGVTARMAPKAETAAKAVEIATTAEIRLAWMFMLELYHKFRVNSTRDGRTAR